MQLASLRTQPASELPTCPKRTISHAPAGFPLALRHKKCPGTFLQRRSLNAFAWKPIPTPFIRDRCGLFQVKKCFFLSPACRPLYSGKCQRDVRETFCGEWRLCSCIPLLFLVASSTSNGIFIIIPLKKTQKGISITDIFSIFAAARSVAALRRCNFIYLNTFLNNNE